MDKITVEEAEAKLHNLMYGEGKWYFAYAMGHGCSMDTGRVDIFMAIIEQYNELRDFIRREKALSAQRERAVA